jgi:hypothetical protein
MCVKSLLIFSTLIFISILVNGQGVSLTGKVIDKQTKEPIIFAHVFIKNTTIGTTTDESGEFTLQNVSMSSLTEVVFSHLAYLPFYLTTERLRTSMPILIELEPSSIQMALIEIKDKKDDDWNQQMKVFKRAFFGRKRESYCEIKNPWVLEFEKGTDGTLIARAETPLEIQNNFLGYRLDFYLKQFRFSQKEYAIGGDAFFTEMQNGRLEKKWNRNRLAVFLGSPRHLLSSIINNTHKEEGYTLYTIVPGEKNSNSRSEIFSLDIDKKVREWLPKVTKDSTGRGVYRINAEPQIEVHYERKAGERRYYSDVTSSISWIDVKTQGIFLDANGLVSNKLDLIYSGDMSNSRVAELLPFDYYPNTPELKNAFFENAYVSTDRPYYYKGETIFLKAYMHYDHITTRISPSKLLYVDLVDEQRQLVKRYRLRIQNGVATGLIQLTDDLRNGNYFLSAYTKWMLNFKNYQPFTLPVPILNSTEKIVKKDEGTVKEESPIKLSLEDVRVIPNETVNLRLSVTDEFSKPTEASLSISVTDTSEVTFLSEQPTIREIPKQSAVLSMAKTPAFPIENNISFTGVYRNEKGRPKKAKLTFVSKDGSIPFSVNSNRKGKFKIENLDFYDTAHMYVMVNDNNSIFGKIEIQEARTPNITAEPYPGLKIYNKDSAQKKDVHLKSARRRTLVGETKDINTELSLFDFKQDKKLEEGDQYNWVPPKSFEKLTQSSPKPKPFYLVGYVRPAQIKNYVRGAALIYWNANINFDESGISKISFPSGGKEAVYRVVIEGFLDDTYVRHVSFIEVKNK